MPLLRAPPELFPAERESKASPGTARVGALSPGRKPGLPFKVLPSRLIQICGVSVFPRMNLSYLGNVSLHRINEARLKVGHA